jgi:hypothetical protein
MIFTQRLSYSLYEGQLNKETRTIRLPHDHPILHLYEYDYDEQTGRLINAKPVPWNTEIHSHYFPTAPYMNDFDPKQYGPKLPFAIKRWLTYPIDVMLQRLAPSRSPRDLWEAVQKKDFRGLVRDVPGSVIPTVLESYTKDEDIRAEAHILYQMTLAMKATRKVWLTFDALVSMALPQQDAALQRLKEAEIIVVHPKDTCTALNWAAKAHDRFMERLKAHSPAGYICIHDMDSEPVAVHKMKWDKELLQAEPLVFRCDTLRAVDNWIDHQQIAISMLNVEWQSHPTLGEAMNTIACTSLKEGFTLLRTAEVHLQRTLVISEVGDVSLERDFEHVLVRWSVEGRSPFKRGDILLIKETLLGDAYLIVKSSHSNMEGTTVSTEVVHSCTTRASSCSYTSSIFMAAGAYDHVVIIGNKHTSIRWLREGLRIAAGKPYTCLQMGHVHK